MNRSTGINKYVHGHGFGYLPPLPKDLKIPKKSTATVNQEKNTSVSAQVKTGINRNDSKKFRIGSGKKHMTSQHRSSDSNHFENNNSYKIGMNNCSVQSTSKKSCAHSSTSNLDHRSGQKNQSFLNKWNTAVVKELPRIQKKSSSSCFDKETSPMKPIKLVHRPAMKAKPQISALSVLTKEQIKLVERGIAPGYLVEAYNNPKKESEWKDEMKKYPEKRQHLPPITREEKGRIRSWKQRSLWPQGSRDMQEISDTIGIDYHKVSHQFKSDPEYASHLFAHQKRQVRDKITVEQKEKVISLIARKNPTLKGSVDRVMFLQEQNLSVRRDQFEYILRR